MGKIIPGMGKNMIDNSLCSGLFGKTRQAVLALLYGRADSSFYTKQVLDAVKIGRGTVQRELKNLTDTGIIIREVQGRQVYYRANAQCPIFDELKSIVRKTFGVADVIRQSLTTVADKIRAAFIFGSVARSADDRASDIDVMIIGEVSFAGVSSAISQAEKLIQREINPVVYPPAEFKQKVKADHNFVNTVLNGEKIFLIGDENELRRLAE
jgi:predicted nucleotidyltransferase